MRLIEAEAIGVTTIAFFAIVAFVAIPEELVQDSWLALVAGREIAANGLPATDSLNVWTQGAEWVDQQWLPQTALYGLFTIGGLRLMMLAHVALLSATLTLGVVAARRLGGTPVSASLLALSCVFVAPWLLQVRAQTAAMPLFVVLLWLLASDSREPSRRVYFALPLLVLWANIHGAVILGAALVALRGLTIARTRSRPFAAVVLTFAPFPCLLASPYGLSLAEYYEKLLFNPLLREYVVEWQASTPSGTTAAFYVYAAGTVWLLARRARLLTLFEGGALLLTMVGGFLAVRSILWFALAGLILLPRLLDDVLPQLPPFAGARRLRLGLALAGIASVAVTAAAVATRSESWFVRAWPAAAADHAAAAAREDAKVISDERYGDWLLWEHPELRGRIAFGVRFELFTATQFEALAAYKHASDSGWHVAADGYAVVVLDRSARSVRSASALTSRGYRVAFEDEKVSVLVSGDGRGPRRPYAGGAPASAGDRRTTATLLSR